MKTAAPPAFYDDLLRNPESALLVEAIDHSPYRTLYERALELIQDDADVIELGCGTGRFAKLLADMPGRTGDYIGIDFAAKTIAEARRYHPDGEFLQADITHWDGLRWNATYVLLEVLEHLHDDIALLARIPTGSHVLLSVPSFDSPSHIRFFPVQGSAANHYAAVLAIDWQTEVPLANSSAFFHLISGRLKP